MPFINIVYKDGYKEDKEEMHVHYVIKNGKQQNSDCDFDYQIIKCLGSMYFASKFFQDWI